MLKLRLVGYKTQKTYPHSPYIQDPHMNPEAQTEHQANLSTKK